MLQEKFFAGTLAFVLTFSFIFSAASAQTTYNMKNIRGYVVGVDNPVELSDGKKVTAINFNNSFTTPPFEPVVEEITKVMQIYGNMGLGKSQLSANSAAVYYRNKILSFVGAAPEKYTCFYVNNTTDGLNKLASALIDSKDDIVLASRMEHNANDLTWRGRCKVVYADVDNLGRLDLKDVERLLKENSVKYVTITAVSNVTGYVNDVHAVAKLAHKHGAKVIVDGAQIVAHRKFSMTGKTSAEDVDFFVFSAHKMYSPFGGGAVIGRTDLLNERMPKFYGAGTTKVVTGSKEILLDAPHRYEAGSINFASVVGLGKAIDVLQEVGFENIQRHEQTLTRKLINGLKKIDGVEIYGDAKNISDRVGIVTFSVKNVSNEKISKQLAERGISVGAGNFSAHSYVFKLLGVSDSEIEKKISTNDFDVPGMIRVSFGVYNTETEIDTFLEALKKIL